MLAGSNKWYETVRLRKNCFFWTAVWKNVFWAAFRKCFFLSPKNPWKKPSQSIGQQRIQPAKKPSKVQQKIDTNFKTTTLAPLALAPKMGRRAPRAAPFLGLLFWILNRFFERVCRCFWPSFFFCLVFCLTFSFDCFFDLFFPSKKSSKPSKKVIKN